VLRRYVICAAIGVIAALAYTLAPLTVVTAILGPLVVWCAARELPQRERQWLYGLVGVAVAVRLAAVAVLFLTAEHDSQAAAILVGDEAYTLSRALRLRNFMLGIQGLKYDWLIAFDEYGRTSYLWVVTTLQLLFGPSPYGLRLVNVLCFLAGTLLLFRLVRRSYGSLPAFAGLAVLLFQPTWLLWSISLLKESLYFLLASSILVAAVALGRAAWIARAVALLAMIAGLYALRDLRAGAVALIASGLALGLVLRVLVVNRARFVIGTLAIVMVATLAITRPDIQTRVMAGMQEAARMHIGHVFTIGHHYKLLDEGFYIRLNREPSLTALEAARFAIRALISFLAAPLPWDIVTRGELLQLPEHVLWYVLLLLTPIGFRTGLRSDPLVTCLLLAYVVPTAAVVALTNGNVGTLIRFRGLVTPYLIWLAGLGLCVIMQQLLARAHRSAGKVPALREASEQI
jgi:hypothetical protein